MSTDEVVWKAIDIMSPVLGEAKAREVADAVMSVEKVSSVRELLELVRRK
jgi:hypothetical protein